METNGLFRYAELTAELVHSVLEVSIAGQTTVVLGAPHAGKSLFIAKLAEALKADSTSFVEISLRDLPRDSSEATILQLFQEALGITGATDDLVELLTSIRDTLPILWISSLDRVAQPTARWLLTQIRTFQQLHARGMIVSGESSLQELIHGPNSEMICTNQIVLQGLGEPYFLEQAERYASALQVQLPECVRRDLWANTGGNTHLMRLAIWALVEYHVRGGTVSTVITSNDIRGALLSTGVLDGQIPVLLKTFLRLIPLQRNVWSSFEALLHGKHPILLEPLGAPGALTLGGVAKRIDGRLEWASPLMEKIVKKHYSATRRADLYAAAGDWAEAFKRYESTKGLPRPNNAEDLPDTDIVISALCASLEAEAFKGTAWVEELALLGFKHVLGFPDVWIWDQKSGWRDQEKTRPPDSARLFAELARASETRPLREFPLPEPWKRAGICWILPAAPPKGPNSLILLGDLHSNAPISLERRKLAIKLLAALHGARQHQHRPEPVAAVLAVDAILNNLLDGNPIEVLKAASSELRAEYRRVLFSLVDHAEQRIQGILDDSDDESVDIARLTDCDIQKDHDIDVQSWVVYHAQPKVIHEAAEDPLANKIIVRAARQKGLAVVPMSDPTGRVVGTIHVERADGQPPSSDEVEALLKVGNELAIILEENKRRRLIQTTLDRLGDPILISDGRGRAAYANKPASDLFGIQAGWNIDGPWLAPEIAGVITGSIEEALKGQRTNKPFAVEAEPNYRGSVTADCLLDHFGGVMGAFAEVHNQKDLFEVLDTLRQIAAVHDQEEVLKRVLAALKRLGHKWARVYVADKQSGLLVGKLSYGFPSDVVTEEFNKGYIPLGSRAARPISWRCLDRGKAMVFRRAKLSEPHRDLRTAFGLEFSVVDETCDPRLLNERRDYWLDVPLFVGQREQLGKITIQCDESLRPERLQLLEILGQITSVTLDALQTRDQLLANREETVKRAAEKSISVVSHNIGTRFSGLAVLLSRYKRLVAECPGIQVLNEEFESAYRSIYEELARAKEMYRGAGAHLSSIDTGNFLRAKLAGWFDEECFDVEIAPEVASFMADPNLIAGVINELCRNSLDAFDKDRLLVKVRANLIDKCGVATIRLQYEDNGPGIAPNLKEKVFDDFFTQRASGKSGMGLGLTYVKQAVRAHGGIVYENGEHGKGARFVIEFPLEPSSKERV